MDVGLAEWIIDDTCFVSFFPNFQNGLGHMTVITKILKV